MAQDAAGLRRVNMGLIALGVAVVIAAALWVHTDAGRSSGDAQSLEPARQETTGTDAAGTSATYAGPIIPAPAVDVRVDPRHTLYSARTLNDLKNVVASLKGDYVLDGLEMEYYADLFCSYGSLDGGVARSFAEVVRMLASGDTGDGMRSAQWLDSLRARFCEGRTGPPPPEFELGLPLVLPHVAGLDELAELEHAAQQIDVAGLVASDAEHTSIEQARQQNTEIRARVLDFMATTESPAAFRRAAEILVTAGDDWYPGNTRAKAVLLTTLPFWRMVGPELAFCRMVPNACAAGSMTTISRCMPINCRPGESLQDYYRRTQSPQTLEIAQAYADALLALRNDRP